MKLSPAENQILLVLSYRGKLENPITRLSLDRFGQRYFQDEKIDWEPGWAQLTSKKFIDESSGEVELTAKGHELSQQIAQEMRIHNYDENYRMIRQSSAFDRYSKQVYGENLGQINLVSINEIDHIITTLQLNAGSLLLDLGCGLGKVTEYISDKTRARVVGVDLAEKTITSANNRTQGKQDRITFKTQDMESLTFPPRFFDTIIAIDSLYEFSAMHLQKLLPYWHGFLKPKGQMGFTFGNNGRKGWRYTPGQTGLGQALANLGWKYNVHDFTAHINQHWQRCLDVAAELEDDFAAENRQDWHKSLVKHAEFNLKHVAHAVLYFYHIHF